MAEKTVGRPQLAADRKGKGKTFFTTEITEVAEKSNTYFMYKGKVKNQVAALSMQKKFRSRKS